MSANRPLLTDPSIRSIDLTVDSSAPPRRPDHVVAVVSAFGAVSQAVAQCLKSAGVAARSTTAEEAGASVRVGETSMVVVVHAQGQNLGLLAEAVRARPGCTLMVAVGAEVVEPPSIPEVHLVVVRSLDELIERVSTLVNPMAMPRGLSKRKLEILQLLASGARPVDAAHQLQISLKTLNNHLGDVYRSMGTRNITQTVLTLIRDGVITL